MRGLLSLTAFVLILPNVAAQPKAGSGASKADFLRMEEEVELLEAHLATRKAHIKAAIADVEGAKSVAEFAIQAQERGTGNALDASRARAALARAEALVEVRECELREVEVKLKFARQRLEDAKARKAARPGPPQAAPAAIAERVKLAKLEAAKADLQAARAEAERAKAELQRAKALAENNVVGKEALQAAEAGFLKAQAAVRKAEVNVVAAEAAVAEETARQNAEEEK